MKDKLKDMSVDEKEYKRFEEIVGNTVSRVDDSRYFDKWGNIKLNTRDIFIELDKNYSEDYPLFTFKVIALLISELNKIIEYQGECEIDEDCVRCVSFLVELAIPDNKDMQLITIDVIESLDPDYYFDDIHEELTLLVDKLNLDRGVLKSI